ncbi:beta-phosphoglucomutase [Secundilactobacillus oryzae JCM 18671]|uniref:Beta-phosphoglucomutase n=1 Tax=Secundilactobacillus oryzae JCM 18671 TaxID=1291743 RepID=A0A081BGG5_9LACO|nr:beta-phosphoglucomutase [Secundilactobacillus oryzae]GAK47133.1 beta-phosphoglucomutase [Secundilactobacillus oryzae JCM 18671]
MKFEDIKGFAFDLDGVIADSARLHSKAWHQTADTVGTTWTPELAENLKGVSRMDSLEMILKAGGHENEYTQAQKEELATAKNTQYLELVKTLTPDDVLPGMKAFLDELKANGYKMSVASASKNAPTILKQLKVMDYFEGIVDPAKLHAGKPDPEIFSLAADVLGLAPANVAGLEDSGAGIQSINAAGELSIGIGSELSEAAVRFDRTDEVSLAAIKAKLA